ncbi:MAG: hypothetical protein DI640_14490 [Sphingomonas taxi]|uniref:Uncharacterized protein n=1 Tax=Sphingomonas taxi TaxID=1549858 RepID=A0A2W4YP05_9SPHN|nr:MAG: hypothetical protein DI640_14490 [Sphingomonas taxi]
MRAMWTAMGAALLLGSAPPLLAQSPPAETATTADRPVETPAGVTVTAPKAWTVRTAPRLVELAAPEGDLKIAVVDIGPSADARAFFDQ